MYNIFVGKIKFYEMDAKLCLSLLSRFHKCMVVYFNEVPSAFHVEQW